MRFLNPSMFFLASALPVVVLFYMLKIRRKESSVSSIYLWQDLLQDIQANTPWQRLRPNILMFLQLLALALLIFSLASPAITKPAESAGNIVLIIDTSQSMGVIDGKDGRTPRLDTAKAKAREIVARAPEGARISLICAADRARVILVNSQDTGLVRREIERLTPEGSSTNLANAITLGASIVSRFEDSRVYVVSDGCFEKATTALRTPVTFIRVGQGGNNVAIRAASLLEDPNPPHDPQLFVSVKNFGRADNKVLVSIYSAKKLIGSRQLTLKGRSMESVVFNDGLSGVSSAEVRLHCGDQLKIDNQAWILKSKGAIDAVSLVSNGNMFLEEGLKAVSPAKVTVVNPKNWQGAGGSDIVVFDGYVPEKLPDRNMIIVNPPVEKGASAPFTAPGFTKISSIEALDPNHAVLQFVDLSEMRVARLKTTVLPGWMRPIAGAKSDAAIAVGEERGRRVVVLSFDLSDSDLPLRVTFPILLANIIDYISPPSTEKNPSQINVGEGIAIKPKAKAESITIDYPDGRKKELDAAGQVFQDTQVPGVYQVKQVAGGTVISEPFAVSLVAQRESDITPAAHSELTLNQSSERDKKADLIDIELWHWIALVALLLLFVEGWVYVKGY